MNWTALTKNQQKMVVATAVLAVVQIFVMAHFFGWTKPASERGGSVKSELIELEKKVEDARAITRQKTSIQSNLTQGVDRLESLVGYAPSASDRYAWAYEYVSHCATQTRISLDNFEEIITDTDDKAGDADSCYEIHITTRCDYNRLVEFLWRLETDNPLLRIKKVTIASAQGISLEHRVQIDIQWLTALKIERGTG